MSRTDLPCGGQSVFQALVRQHCIESCGRVYILAESQELCGFFTSSLHRQVTKGERD